MIPHRFQVVPPDDPALLLIGAAYTFLLDGVEIYPSDVTVRFSPRATVEVTLDLPMVTVSKFEGDAIVVIPADVEDTLIGLGWVPPAPDLPTERVPDDAVIQRDAPEDDG